MIIKFKVKFLVVIDKIWDGIYNKIINYNILKERF